MTTQPMPTPESNDPEPALRRLCALPASAFGERLLQRASGRTITFRQFVDVAREMVREQPEVSATYLAAMVALDMRTDPEPRHVPPSDN